MKKTIMIDMDDVITDTDFVLLVEEYLGRKIDMSNQKNFYLQDNLSEEDKKIFFSSWDKVNLYEKCLPYEGCVEAIKKLCTKYEVFICTDFVWREAVQFAGTNAKNKYDYLIKHFPFLDPKHIIMGGVKSFIKADIKIDDRLCNLENADMKLLFTAYHNKEMSDEELKEDEAIRVNDWNEVLKVLM